MSVEPDVSIVIPTYNRRERLARVLGALDGQSLEKHRFEVVIVDDGSTDDTGAWLSTQKRAYAIRVLRQANGGPARARNAGVEAARGRLLLFIDDDVEPSPDLVAEHVRAHEQESDLVVMGPLASLAHYRQPWVAWEQAKLEDQYAAMTRGDWEPTPRQFWTGNASILREHLLAAGGFNPDFLRGEDVELGVRLHNRGLKFRFNARARGLHHAERSLASWEMAHQSYGRLEVQIFSHWGEQELIDVLAGNWKRLHPATRWLVRKCLDRPRYGQGASITLRTWLEIERKVGLGRPVLSDKVCSALANLLYWRASVEALGPERAGRVFERAEELARAEVPA